QRSGDYHAGRRAMDVVRGAGSLLSAGRTLAVAAGRDARRGRGLAAEPAGAGRAAGTGGEHPVLVGLSALYRDEPLPGLLRRGDQRPAGVPQRVGRPAHGSLHGGAGARRRGAGQPGGGGAGLDRGRGGRRAGRRARVYTVVPEPRLGPPVRAACHPHAGPETGAPYTRLVEWSIGCTFSVETRTCLVSAKT